MTDDKSYKKTICLEDYFVNMTYIESATKAIDRAKSMQKKGTIDDCHIVAHMVGKANLVKYKYDIGRALGTCPMSCIQGCIHGAVQNYIVEKVDIDNLQSELSAICDDLRPGSLLQRQCIHGMGHGFLTGGYMKIGEAIKACQNLGGTKTHYCLGGLFMENMQKNLLLPENEFKNALPTTCTTVEKQNVPAMTRLCYIAVGEGIMFYTAHNLAKSLGYCGNSSDSLKNIQYCKKGARDEARTVIFGDSRSPH